MDLPVRWHTATILLVYFLALFMDVMRREEFRMSSRGLLLLNYIAWLWLCVGEPLLPQSIVERPAGKALAQGQSV